MAPALAVSWPRSSLVVIVDRRASSSTGASVGERAALARLFEQIAGLIASVALTTVTVARDAELSPGVIVGRSVPRPLRRRCVVVRRTVGADGALLPLTAVLTAFG